MNLKIANLKIGNRDQKQKYMHIFVVAIAFKMPLTLTKIT